MGKKEIDKINEYAFDKWRELNYSTEYMYFPKDVMDVVTEVVKAERRGLKNEN